MSRTRYLKPAFFENEELADCPPLARLLFAGLWCHADREGRLEDRPRRLKSTILAYDDCNVDDLLAILHDKGFILRYQADGNRYIQVLKFTAHQHPHGRETPSQIPPPEECLPYKAMPEHDLGHAVAAPRSVQGTTQAMPSPTLMGNGEWGMGNENSSSNENADADGEGCGEGPPSASLNGGGGGGEMDATEEEAVIRDVLSIFGLPVSKLNVENVRGKIQQYSQLNIRNESRDCLDWHIRHPGKGDKKPSWLARLSTWLKKSEAGRLEDVRRHPSSANGRQRTPEMEAWMERAAKARTVVTA